MNTKTRNHEILKRTMHTLIDDFSTPPMGFIKNPESEKAVLWFFFILPNNITIDLIEPIPEPTKLEDMDETVKKLKDKLVLRLYKEAKN